MGSPSRGPWVGGVRLLPSLRHGVAEHVPVHVCASSASQYWPWGCAAGCHGAVFMLTEEFATFLGRITTPTPGIQMPLSRAVSSWRFAAHAAHGAPEYVHAGGDIPKEHGLDTTAPAAIALTQPAAKNERSLRGILGAWGLARS